MWLRCCHPSSFCRFFSMSLELHLNRRFYILAVRQLIVFHFLPTTISGASMSNKRAFKRCVVHPRVHRWVVPSSIYICAPTNLQTPLRPHYAHKTLCTRIISHLHIAVVTQKLLQQSHLVGRPLSCGVPDIKPGNVKQSVQSTSSITPVCIICNHLTTLLAESEGA